MTQHRFYIYPAQAQFLNSSAWCRGFVGGRGTGKTTIGAYDLLTRARAGQSFTVVSPSYPMMEETTWPTFRSVAEELGLWVRGTTGRPAKARWMTLDGGFAEAVFRSGDDPDSLRGPSKAGLWIDEAQKQSEKVFDIGIATLRHKGTMGWLSMTFTPAGRRHWTYRTFYRRDREVETPQPDSELVRARTDENPFLSEQFYTILKSRYSAMFAAQELGGEFVEMAGLLFNRQWFPVVDTPPRQANRLRYWDKAATPPLNQDGEEIDPCYSAGVLISRDYKDGLYYIEDVIRGQWSPRERDAVILQTAERDARRYNNEVLIYGEQEPGSGGKESMESMIRMLAGYPVRRDVVGRGKRERLVLGEKMPGEAKIVRAQPLASQCEAGNVRIVRGKWNDDFLDELTSFPESKHCDQVDAASAGFNKLSYLYGFKSHPVAERQETPKAEPAERYGVQVKPSETRRPEEQRGWKSREGWFT